MPRQGKKAPTLFDIDWYSVSEPHKEIPYSDCIELKSRREVPGFDEDELSVFGHVVEHEAEGYDQRGMLFGPAKLHVRYQEPFPERPCLVNGTIRLPTVAEPEFVDIIECTASGILLVESSSVFCSLARSSTIEELGLLLITGSGVPRETTRKFIRRLHVEAGLRVHLLTDNDTWGYFIYSLLLRGAMGPHACFPWAAVHDVNYIGIRSGDCDQVELPQSSFRFWEEKWSQRLSALREYECFQTSLWQDELSRFECQKFAVNLGDFIEAVGGTDIFVKNYVSPRL